MLTLALADPKAAVTSLQHCLTNWFSPETLDSVDCTTCTTLVQLQSLATPQFVQAHLQGLNVSADPPVLSMEQIQFLVLVSRLTDDHREKFLSTSRVDADMVANALRHSAIQPLLKAHSEPNIVSVKRSFRQFTSLSRLPDLLILHLNR